MSLWVKTNRFVKTIFPNYIWDIPNKDRKIYLTFDDGPIPEVTEWTLAQLKKHNAKSCSHKNVPQNVLTVGTWKMQAS